MINVRTRIAPSPTGSDLHIGNLYTALLNFVFARKNKGKFIVRIEDTDRTRYIEGAEEKILTSLKWFGLSYDEGVDIGGPYGPYRQSQRLDLYKMYAMKLIESGHAYYCDCNQERLETMRKLQKEKGQPTLYDGKCKNEDQSIKKAKGKYVVRLNVPDSGTTDFVDIVRGKISFDNRLIDDQIILKSDGYPTYHLAVVVDDYLMKISHVIRAEEWISSTPKHILIYNFLGWPLPQFAHGPILRSPDKSKLSKRKNPVWVSWYREQGFLPDAILNFLALMGWSMPDGREIFTISEMMDHFKLQDLKTVGPSFDIRKLEWMNGEYLRKIHNSKLKSQIFNYLDGKYPEDIIEKTIPLVKERIKKLADYLPLTEFIFKRPENYETDFSDKKEVLKDILSELEKVDTWKGDIIGKTMQKLCDNLGMKTGEFFMILRVAVSGKKISPPLNESMEILGKKEVLERLSKLVQK